MEEKLEPLRAELEKKDEELQLLREQNLRLQADFENAKKRWLKTQAEIQETANWDLLRELLEIYDDFERALAVGNSANSESSNFRTGVEMIAKRMSDFLKSMGVVPMEAVGKTFDPIQHDAVAHEATDQVAESTVLHEIRKGYWMNGRVLRPAVVKVATKKEV